VADPQVTERDREMAKKLVSELDPWADDENSDNLAVLETPELRSAVSATIAEARAEGRAEGEAAEYARAVRDCIAVANEAATRELCAAHATNISQTRRAMHIAASAGACNIRDSLEALLPESAKVQPEGRTT